MLQELFKNGFSQSLVNSRERKKNTRGSKHPNNLRTTLKRVLSSAPFTCFCMCQVLGCTQSRHQTLSRQSRAPPALPGWCVSPRRACTPPSIPHGLLTGSRRAHFPGYMGNCCSWTWHLNPGLILAGETPALLNSISLHPSWILLFKHTCLLSYSCGVSNLHCNSIDKITSVLLTGQLPL